MTDALTHLLRDEAQRLDVPPAPLSAIVRDGRRRRAVRRARDTVVVAASVAIVVGVAVVGARGLLSDGAAPPPAQPAPAGTPTDAPPSTTVTSRVTVSRTGVGTQPFGADADAVRAAVVDRLGEPDLTLGPERYARAAGSDSWVRDGGDPMSPAWRYPVASVDCWAGFCLLFGGDDAGSLKLRGWELSRQSRWGAGGAEDGPGPDVRLAGSDLRLGDTWAQLHAAYPRATGAGGEGASLVVADTPWPGISDGVGAWRLSGSWDYQRPNHVPANAVVTRLSAGEGPEPGCC